MGTRSQGMFALALLLGLARAASADPKTDLEKAGKTAMENYDLMDYDAAKTSLVKAIKTADSKFPKDPVTAKLHLYLGITTFAGGDQDGAKKEFVTAAKIDSKIQIEAAYKSPELTKLLESAKSEAGGSSSKDPGGGDDDCTGVKGLQFKEPDGGKIGIAQPIEAMVGSDVKFDKVAVMYRSEGSSDFTEVKLSKASGCKYTGQIPGAALKGSVVHYYVAAFEGGRAIKSASAGSASAPNILELSAAPKGTPVGDGEDPINKGKGKKKDKDVATTTGGDKDGGDVSGGVLAGGKPAKVFIAIAGGTGFGYLAANTGTEGGNTVQSAGFGNSFVVITPELGYYVNPQLSIGIAGRIGLPLGANVDPPMASHSTIAPGAMLRVRYTLSHTGEGLRLMGQVGGGVMRNTIKLQMPPTGGDTDIVAQGPLLVGGGIGFMHRLGGKVAFVADLSALAGIAVVNKLGTSKLSNGIGADLSLGLAVGF